MGCALAELAGRDQVGPYREVRTMRLRRPNGQQRQIRARREPFDLRVGHPLQIVESACLELAQDRPAPIDRMYPLGFSNGRPSRQNNPLDPFHGVLAPDSIAVVGWRKKGVPGDRKGAGAWYLLRGLIAPGKERASERT
jgi:hypothetical protein